MKKLIHDCGITIVFLAIVCLFALISANACAPAHDGGRPLTRRDLFP
jgi:hypothetical protein